MDPEREPRLLFGARFNLAATLLDLGRTADAAALLPEVRALAGRLGHRLDLCRLRWLEAKVLAAQDRLDEAAAALGEAHQDFVDQQIAYDAAFTALDLAEIHLRRGRTAEVRELALATMEVLRAQKVPGGFLAGFQLFCRAAEQDAATAELVRRTARELEKARGGE
jgi:tetratricopeptide (TPR) repeat protein